jgi:mono/diheme cytochrome c family protein
MRKVLIAAALAAGAGPAAAEDGAGRAAYVQNCAGCHGAEARGDGPLAALLTVPVPDLTRLAAENGGEFPLRAVVETIDGRNTRAGHGGAMPVFGALMGGDGGVIEGVGGTPLITRGIILSLAYYLEEIQE